MAQDKSTKLRRVDQNCTTVVVCLTVKDEKAIKLLSYFFVPSFLFTCTHSRKHITVCRLMHVLFGVSAKGMGTCMFVLMHCLQMPSLPKRLLFLYLQLLGGQEPILDDSR